MVTVTPPCFDSHSSSSAHSDSRHTSSGGGAGNNNGGSNSHHRSPIQVADHSVISIGMAATQPLPAHDVSCQDQAQYEIDKRAVYK